MTRAAGLVLAALLIVTACSSDPIAESVTPAQSAMVTEPASPEFCDGANAFVTSTDARLVNTPSAEVFEQLTQSLARLETIAPAAVAEDIGTLRIGYDAIGTEFATVNFDPSAELTLPTDVVQANGAAVRSLQDYLLDACDLAQVRTDQIADIVEAFGVQDQALAECLHSQLGDVANIESASLTPELMITNVCGTSIIGLLSGEGETDS